MNKKIREWFVTPEWEVGEPIIEGDTISPNLKRWQSKFKKKIVNPLVSFYLNHWKWIIGLAAFLVVSIIGIIISLLQL